ncbi:MAG TPA: Gldg family protein [Chloroflexota bacterium]|nr:Gldg family protein [Chloroflexota bacterium]
MATLLERIRLPVLVVGGLALLAAGAWYLVTGEFGLPPRVLLVAGVLLVGIYVAIEPGEVAGALGARTTRYGANTVLAVVLFVGILGLANFLSIRYSHRWDVTASGQFSLSAQTQKVLDGLTQPVHIVAFMTPGEQLTENTESLLRNYETASGGKLSWELIDPDANPGLARQYNIRQYNTLVLQQGDKRQDTTSLDEAGITAALIKLTAAQQPKVYFLTGHGERSPEATGQDSYSQMRQALQNDNFQVASLNLLTAQTVPADAAAVIIASPQQPLLPEELTALNQYLDAAGHVFLLADPRTAEYLAPLLQRWNLSFSGDLVVDLANALQIGQLADPRAIVIQQFGFHTITRDLARDRTPVLFVEATNLNLPSEQQSGVQITRLVETSADRSWTKKLDAQTIEFQEGVDQRGPLVLAVAVEADAPNAPAPPDRPDAPPAARPKTRAVIVGDADFPSNNVARPPFFNRDLFVNAVNWLTGSEELASLRARPPEQRQMFLTGVQRNTIFFTTVLFLPALVLVAGGLVWWNRR